jgi:hypothetical protein
MKANQSKTAKAVNVAYAMQAPNSLKDAGYKLAQAGESLATVAQYVMENAPVSLDDMSVNSHKELRADLAEGYKLRAHELWGIDYYVVSKDTGAWLKIGNSLDPSYVKALEDHKGREIKQVNVHYVTSISTVDYGRMKSENPAERAVVQPMREKFTKYEKDRNDSLIGAIKKLIADAKGEKRERKDVPFIDAVLKMFDAWDKSVKVKETKGDKSADPLRFRMARDAFLKAYNTK